MEGKTIRWPASGVIAPVKLAIAWFCFDLLRRCERLLPLKVLSLLLWPPTAFWDLLHVRRRRLFSSFGRFPDSWHVSPVRFFLRQSFGLSHSQPLYVWPDRLAEKKWLDRCPLEGATEWVVARADDRPVILASLHFGPFETLPYWLRAHGIVTTTLRGCSAPESLRRLTNYQYALSAPPNVPVFISAKEMSPLPRFAHVRHIIGPSRRLLANVDVDRGPQFYLPFEGKIFRMATGAIRLAAMADADLVPCLIRETDTWKFVIHFGNPVPREYLGKTPNLGAAGACLLEEFARVLTRYPEQCRSRLLAAMLQPNEEGKVQSVSPTVPATVST